MPALFRRARIIDPRVTPTVHVELDRSHPLAAGLVGLWAPGAFPGVNFAGVQMPTRLINNPSFIGSKVGPVLSLDGSSQYVNASTDVSLNPSTELTLTFLANPSNLPSSYREMWVIGRDDNTLGRAFAFGFANPSNPNWTYWLQVNGASGPVGGLVAANVWSVGSATWKSNLGKIYANGVFLSSATLPGPINTTTGPTTIGARTYSGAEGFFPGSIAFVAQHNRAISDDLIAWINAEPFAMLIPRIRRRYYLVTAKRNSGNFLIFG